MLNGRYELLGIKDVEAFTARISEKTRSQLSYHDSLDLHAFLISECWELSLRYEAAGRASPPSLGRSFAGQSSSGSAGGSAGADGSTRTASSNGRGSSSSASMPTLPNAIDWERLSERGSAILRTIAVLLAAGYSPREVGLELGTSTRWVLTRLEELADELERLS